MDSFKRYIMLYGLPQSAYLDRHSTYKSKAKQTIEEELNDIQPMSHFERVWPSSASRSSMPTHLRLRDALNCCSGHSRTG